MPCDDEPTLSKDSMRKIGKRRTKIKRDWENSGVAKEENVVEKEEASDNRRNEDQKGQTKRDIYTYSTRISFGFLFVRCPSIHLVLHYLLSTSDTNVLRCEVPSV